MRALSLPPHPPERRLGWQKIRVRRCDGSGHIGVGSGHVGGALQNAADIPVNDHMALGERDQVDLIRPERQVTDGRVEMPFEIRGTQRLAVKGHFVHLPLPLSMPRVLQWQAMLIRLSEF